MSRPPGGTWSLNDEGPRRSSLHGPLCLSCPSVSVGLSAWLAGYGIGMSVTEWVAQGVGDTMALRGTCHSYCD
eukprot:COSAG02_NODE_4938_length_4811_cov_23.006791_7_plen_73_part_00